MELAKGIEPITAGLQNRCSTVELRQRDSTDRGLGIVLAH